MDELLGESDLDPWESEEDTEGYSFDDEWNVLPEEINVGDLCRYGCGKMASSSFGVCDEDVCISEFIEEYPETLLLFV
jgi:hypothetical protein